MSQHENVTSWKSAIRGLTLLGMQTPNVFLDIKIPAKEVAKELDKEDKKKIKTAVRFIKYILKNI